MSGNNAERDQALYKYPDSNVLRNKLDIRNVAELSVVEKMLVQERIEQGPPSGDFDLKHLCVIHRFLFQDVYEWAGELRKVDFHKSSWFLLVGRIENGMADVHRRLVSEKYLSGLSPVAFANQASVIIGDVNYCHPFREGNGRTQLQYLKQLGTRAGHEINLAFFERKSWIEASMAGNEGDYSKMESCIRSAMAD